MLFKKPLIDKILKGKKTTTSRSKQLYKENDVTNLMANKDYSKITGKYIRIKKVYPKPLGKFTEDDAKKEGFENLLELKQYWVEKKIGLWTAETIVWVHEFEIL